MRRIRFENEFDAAGNLWTSLGYFTKESDNRLVLKRLFAALKPGGRFMLHIINRDWIVAHYSADGWYTAGEVLVMEKRWFDWKHSVSRGKWHFVKNGKRTSHQVDIRMYSYHELIAILTSVGFVDVEGFGSTKDEPISSDRRMMFITARKPKD
jgi:hypothetical protein